LIVDVTDKINIIRFLGLDGVCGARDGLKGSKGEPGHPGEAGKLKYLFLKKNIFYLHISIQEHLVNVVHQEKKVIEVILVHKVTLAVLAQLVYL
jgi:hypothetical protein